GGLDGRRPRGDCPRRASSLAGVGDAVSQPVPRGVRPERIEAIEGGFNVLATQLVERLACVAHLDANHRRPAVPAVPTPQVGERELVAALDQDLCGLVVEGGLRRRGVRELERLLLAVARVHINGGAFLAASGGLVGHHLEELCILLGPAGDGAPMHEIRDAQCIYRQPRYICTEMQLAHLKAHSRAVTPTCQEPLDLGPGVAIPEAPQEGRAKGDLAADAVEVAQAEVKTSVRAAQQPAPLPLPATMWGDEQWLAG